MIDASVGVVREKTSDPAKALSLLRRDGAVVLIDAGMGSEAARQVGFRVFGDLVANIPEAARVFAGGEMDKMPKNHSSATRGKAHTDGFSYGDAYPDYFLLKCEHHCEVGGDSFLIDGYQLLEHFKANADTAWIEEALRTVPVDQTEEGKRTSISPVVQQSPGGRTMVRRMPEQRSCADSADPARDMEMLRAWEAAIDEAEEAAPRFKLLAGEAVIIDNYRLFHGREPYRDPMRLMWRVWAWTKEAKNVPAGILHSDSRYAGAL